MVAMGLMLLFYFGVPGVALLASSVFGTPSGVSMLDRVFLFTGGVFLLGISGLSIWRGIDLMRVPSPDEAPVPPRK